MNDYLLLFRGRNASQSPEQMQRALERWQAWFADLRATGRLKDRGHPLEDGRKIVGGKQRVVTDGPFIEVKDLVNGYIVIEADDIDAATELAKGCPTLDAGGSVEVRPVRPHGTRDGA
ncbi:MAG TPA: YciI family protein [Xanthobacteraceae bacterium]|nr:YciI family protein [Xanthobacteraceae bacterium]